MYRHWSKKQLHANDGLTQARAAVVCLLGLVGGDSQMSEFGRPASIRTSRTFGNPEEGTQAA